MSLNDFFKYTIVHSFRVLSLPSNETFEHFCLVDVVLDPFQVSLSQGASKKGTGAAFLCCEDHFDASNAESMEDGTGLEDGGEHSSHTFSHPIGKRFLVNPFFGDQFSH